jgi:hypothetical protein
VPTRVLVEGPEIEPLLAQIREEYGEGVRIVSADKVRSGGVAGFFTRQRFEIAIEVEDSDGNGGGPGAAAAPRSGAAQSLLDLVEAREDRFDPTPTRVGAHRRPDDGQAEEAGPAGSLPPRAGLVSTTGDAFAEVMAGLRGQGLAAKDDVPTVRPFRPAVVDPGTVVAPGSGGPVSAAAASTVAPTSSVSNVAPAAPVADVAPATPASDATPATPASNVASATPVAPATTVLPAEAPPAATATPAPAATSSSSPWLRGLVSLGMPAFLARRAIGADPYQAVLTALADLPAPAPPARPGDILVIIGDVARAWAVALQVSRTLHIDPARILLAGAATTGTSVTDANRISGPADAERRSRRMHRADTAHVVVVDAPVDGADPDWVRAVCDALGATAVWAVVDATRKTADSARQLLGPGKVDAIAVYAVSSSGDPASVLAVGPPVALLDDQPATAYAWAGMLSQRLLSAHSCAEERDGTD